MMPLSTLPKCRFLLVQKCEPDVIRTRNLLIWSQTRYRCATGPNDHDITQKVKCLQHPGFPGGHPSKY